MVIKTIETTMTQQQSIVKQLHINRILLPEDILNEIKSYCFYEFIVGKTRIQKKELVKSIQESFTSGVGDEWFQQEEDPKLFLFATKNCIHRPKYGVQLQMRFCMDCGDYVTCSTYDQMNQLIEKLRCSCVPLDHFQHDDDDIQDEEYHYDNQYDDGYPYDE